MTGILNAKTMCEYRVIPLVVGLSSLVDLPLSLFADSLALTSANSAAASCYSYLPCPLLSVSSCLDQGLALKKWAGDRVRRRGNEHLPLLPTIVLGSA